MDDLIKLEVNGETGEGVTRPFTQQEIDDYNAILAAEQAAKDAAVAADNIKASAVSKLASLGLTPDEVSALFNIKQ